MLRTITAITTIAEKLTALCDDGTVWQRSATGEWTELAGVPQPHGESTCNTCRYGQARHNSTRFQCLRYPPGHPAHGAIVMDHNFCGEYVRKG